MLSSKQALVFFMATNGWSCTINREVFDGKNFTGAVPFNLLRYTSRIFTPFAALSSSFLSNHFEIHAPIVH